MYAAKLVKGFQVQSFKGDEPTMYETRYAVREDGKIFVSKTEPRSNFFVNPKSERWTECAEVPAEAAFIGNYDAAFFN